jgi:NAD(P)-dependent dehydrogenase (short-subunit alcohol dehydrogenase family)
MNLHLKGTFFLTQKLLPLIADGGWIVNISSGLARFSLPGYSAYAAMKRGMEVLTRYLPRNWATRYRRECRGAGRDRDGLRRRGSARQRSAQRHYRFANGAWPRGVPDDTGGAIAALLLPENRWVNGQRIEVSGRVFL